MKRFVVMGVVVLCALGRAEAQTSIDVLEDDLKEAKATHDSSASQLMTTFLGTLQSAEQSPAVALDLYQKAGGNLPDAAPVHHHYQYETPTEKAEREAIDASNFQTVAIVIQLHCGLMRNAALLALTPNAPGVQEGWLDWLKSTAALYPQLQGKRALKDVTMHDSVISNYLGFSGWGDSDQGKWSLSDLPQLYHDQVLEPLRHPPTQATIDAWNTYIAMKQADEPDQNKWAQQIEPALDFDRDVDDYNVLPSMDKLAALDAIIKANPTSDHLTDWINRMQTLIDSYRQGGTKTGLLPGATPGTPSSEAPGLTPTASPGTPASGTTAANPTASPGTSSTGGATVLPSATPGTPSSGTTGTTPAATPGTPSAGTTTPVPGATPGTAQ
jgi:hypothetical protein